MKKLWEATYVIGETSTWANAHPDRANARYGWKKAIVSETIGVGGDLDLLFESLLSSRLRLEGPW